jgi:type IV secretory pathway VirB4 component
MINLAEYRKRPALLADFLPWAALIAPGVVLNKDGSFQRTARFRGPDLDSATPRRTGWHHGKVEQCTAAAGLGLGDLR